MTATVKLALVAPASPAATVALPKGKRAPVTADKPVAKPLPFARGKGSEARMVAFGDIATLTYIAATSHRNMVATLRTALGNKPTVEQVMRARAEYIVGKVAFAIAVNPKATYDNIQLARTIIAMPAPPKDGVKARNLPKGIARRRTVAEHKAIRAAESAWSLVKAEVAPEQSNAKTLTEKNKVARAPAMKGTTARGNANAAPTHTELVKGDSPMTADKANAYLSGMAATLLAFINKNAAHVMGGRGEAVKAFHTAIAAADKASRDA